MLHITNGESVLHSFRDGSMPGEYLSWADVLHDGPVPLTATLEELSEIRAHTLAEQGGSYPRIRRGLARRDQVFRSWRDHDEVVLWFEHDLYDQLQLLQILDFFACEPPGHLTLIQIDRHPEVEPFYGLGQLSGAQLNALLSSRIPVTPSHLSQAQEAWRAFRSPEPTGLMAVASRDSVELPFLRAALVRFFEEYPWTKDGLSRMQRHILEAVDEGRHQKHGIYDGSRKKEAFPWGDTSVFQRIDALASGANPALDHHGTTYELTTLGRALLKGAADWIRAQGKIDVWLGGVHLTGTDAAWRWDGAGHLIPS